MPRTLIAGLCALTLVLAGCGDDGDSADTVEETTTTAADETTTTADESTTTEAGDPADETTTTAEEPDDSGEGSGDGTEGDPDAVALAQAINLTIADFDDTWTESPAEDDDGGPSIDDCFVETDIEAATVGEAETGTFSYEPGPDAVQLVTMQTVVLDSPETAQAIVAELQGDAFATCAGDGLASGFGEGAEVSLTVRPDDPAWTEESVGLVGDVAIPNGDAVAQGAMDLHVLRTGEVVSFTASIDVGVGGLEALLGQIYATVAERHAAEVG